MHLRRFKVSPVRLAICTLAGGCLLYAFAIVVDFSGLTHVSYTLKIRECMKDLRDLYAVIEEHRAHNEGNDPPSLESVSARWEQQRQARVAKEWREVGIELSSIELKEYCDYYMACKTSSTCLYNPRAHGRQPLVIVLGIEKRTAVWLSADGSIFRARQRILGIWWPVYKDSRRSLWPRILDASKQESTDR